MQKGSQNRVGSNVVWALAAIGAVSVLQAQSLPSIQPTSLPSNNAMPAPIAGTSNPSLVGSSTPRPAQVTVSDNQINVRANDSSLNQILRSISRKTGLKITGGVQDERVFGDYGPAPISSVLATLLDGTGTNILFLAGDPLNPPRLVLTPRGGGPTPPSPDSPTYSGYDERNAVVVQPAQSVASPQVPASPVSLPPNPTSAPQPLNNVNGSPSNASPTASTLPTTNSVPLDSVPTPSTTPSTSGIVDAPNPPAPGSTTGTSPNGTLTPEQVYQELLKRQQQQQPASTPPTSPQP
jgi:hypothetical protein